MYLISDFYTTTEPITTTVFMSSFLKTIADHTEVTLTTNSVLFTETTRNNNGCKKK
jgi:hypothetical protein